MEAILMDHEDLAEVQNLFFIPDTWLSSITLGECWECTVSFWDEHNKGDT